MKQIIIDADPGPGDALAIALALQDRELDVLAVTACAGCVGPAQSTRNVQAIISALDPPKWPRIGAAIASKVNLFAGPDAEAADEVNPRRLWGATGLGDWDPPVPELHHRHDAPKVMLDLVRTYPGQVTLLTLGPLTNVAAASERAPDFLASLDALVCLGGAVACGGDITPAAEFNIYADPESARHVVRSPCTMTLVPLDQSQRLSLTLDQFQEWMSGAQPALRDLLRHWIPFAFRACHLHWGLEALPLPEVVALAAAARPGLVKAEMMAVDVALAGIARGATVFDRRRQRRWRPNVGVVSDVDLAGVFHEMQRLLRAET
jgi:inosine-uridine nucleoside N-ribohydrolase